MDKITVENYKKVDLEKLTNNPDHGKFHFVELQDVIKKLKNTIIEFEKLGFDKKLVPEQVKQVHSFVERFVERLENIRIFDIGNQSEADHTNLVSDIRQFCNSTLRELQQPLTFLRLEAQSQNIDRKKLNEQVLMASEAQKKYEEIAKKHQDEIDKMRSQISEQQAAKVERAAVTFGKHFEVQAQEFEDEKEGRWYKLRSKFFFSLLGIIGLNIMIYVSLLFAPNIEPDVLFTPAYGLAKLALIGLLSYGLGFASKNYSYSRDMKVMNLHKKNIAETLTDFMSAETDPADRALLVRSAAENMFSGPEKQQISHACNNDNGPLYEAINKLIPKIEK